MAVIDGATATTAPRGACYHLVFRWLDRSALYVPIVQRPRTWPFQGQNTGSNPVGDATANGSTNPLKTFAIVPLKVKE